MAVPEVSGRGSRGPLAALYPLLAAITVLSYVAAVVIALPLGVTGVVRTEYCVIPLVVANLMLGLVIAGEA